MKRSLVVGLNSSTKLQSSGKLLSYVISAKEETEEDSQGRPSVTSSQVWLWEGSWRLSVIPHTEGAGGVGVGGAGLAGQDSDCRQLEAGGDKDSD